MLTEKQLKLIEKNVSGTLTSEEKQEFERYQHDTEFQQELEFQESLQQAVRLEYHEAFKDTLDQLTRKSLEDNELFTSSISEEKNELKENKDSYSAKGKTFPLSWLLAIAATLVITLSIIFLFITNSSDSIEHLAWAGAEKGDSNPTTTEAFETYEKKNYRQAKQLFSKIPQSERNDEVLLYYAITLLLVDNDEDLNHSIDYLRKLIASNSNYKEVSEWYLAQAYLAKGNDMMAIELLEKISQNPQHPYFERATQKLKQ